MKIKCLLVDDEPLAISLLQKHLEQLENFEVVGTCNNALKAVEILNTKDIDLLFLDIKMPKVSGIDLLRTLRRAPNVIITTAYREYALDGYDLDIVDYLLKPITINRFLKSIEKFLRLSNKTVSNVSSSSEKNFIYIKSVNKFFRINIDDILYVESMKDYIKVCTKEREIIAKYKISDFEKELEGKGFLRVHRSFIVSVSNITSFTAASLEIHNISLPIGSSYKEYVFKALNIGRYSG